MEQSYNYNAKGSNDQCEESKDNHAKLHEKRLIVCALNGGDDLLSWYYFELG